MLINLLIAILVAFLNGGYEDACKVGEPLGSTWEYWLDNNDEKIVLQLNGFSSWSDPKPDELTVWFYREDSGHIVTFIFNPNNMPHGCAKRH